MNIRRLFKHLLKNFQRGSITDKEIRQILMDKGLYTDLAIWDIIAILKTNIKGRIITRIGKAAKKHGAFVQLRDFYKIWRCGNVRGYELDKTYSDYHLIPFVIPKERIVEEIYRTRENWLETLDGKRVGALRTMSIGTK